MSRPAKRATRRAGRCGIGSDPRRSSPSVKTDAAAVRCGQRIATAAAFAVPVGELIATSRRSAYVAFARQSAMYLAHVTFGLSYTEVGRAFGRDRTTAALCLPADRGAARRSRGRCRAGLAGKRLRRAAPQAQRAGAAMSARHDAKPSPPQTLAGDAGIDPLRAQHLELGRAPDPRRDRRQRRHRRRGGKPAGLAGAAQGPRRPRADRAGAACSPASGCAPSSPARN